MFTGHFYVLFCELSISLAYFFFRFCQSFSSLFLETFYVLGILILCDIYPVIFVSFLIILLWYFLTCRFLKNYIVKFISLFLYCFWTLDRSSTPRRAAMRWPCHSASKPLRTWRRHQGTTTLMWPPCWTSWRWSIGEGSSGRSHPRERLHSSRRL